MVEALIYANVTGPTGSGKIVFMKSIFQNLPDMIDPFPDAVIYCYGEWQPMYQEIKRMKFVEGFLYMEKWTCAKILRHDGSS